jgi:hypothetical protein
MEVDVDMEHLMVVVAVRLDHLEIVFKSIAKLFTTVWQIISHRKIVIERFERFVCLFVSITMNNSKHNSIHL